MLAISVSHWTTPLNCDIAAFTVTEDAVIVRDEVFSSIDELVVTVTPVVVACTLVVPTVAVQVSPVSSSVIE